MKTTESSPVPTRSHVPPPRRNRLGAKIRHAFTLTEVMVAMTLFSMTTLGILGAFVQSRRGTDFQKKQIQVETLIQGILEQLKNRTANELLPSPIPTSVGIPAGEHCLTSMARMNTFIANGGTPLSVSVELDTNPGNNISQLRLSPYPIITLDNIGAGAIPADTDSDGYGDINADSVDDVGVNTVFLDLNGTNGLDGSANITTDDLRVNIMLWISDYSSSSAAITVPSRAIVINYTWTYSDGRTTRAMRGSARAVRTPL